MISISINVDKINEDRLFKGEKGKYLDMVLIERTDDYGNDYMVVQSVSKEERERGVKGNILGNGRIIVKRDPINHNTPPDESFDNDNLGF